MARRRRHPTPGVPNEALLRPRRRHPCCFAKGDAPERRQGVPEALQRAPTDPIAKAGSPTHRFQLGTQYAQQGRNEDAKLVFLERSTAPYG